MPAQDSDEGTGTARVSIVVRTKDRPSMLTRTFDDVLAQTFADWQIIIVNDGGDVADVEKVIASREEQLSGRYLVVHNPESGGRPAAANRGFERANSDYVILHDDDDLWHAEFLARTVAHLDAHPESVAVSVPTEIVTEEADGDVFVEIDRRPFNPPGDIVSLFDLILINRIVPISLLVRGSVQQKIGGWDEMLLCVGDWDFNLRLAAVGRIDYLRGDVLAYWMHRPGVATGSLANSMYSSTTGHFEFDRLVRERSLRADGPHHEISQLLYLSKFIDERIEAAENRIIEAVTARLQGSAEYYSPGATLRRAVRRSVGKK